MSDTQSLVALKTILEQLKNELRNSINDENFFNEFIKDLYISSFENNTIFLVCKNAFIQQTLTTDYLELFQKFLNKKCNTNNIKVVFITNASKEKNPSSTQIKINENKNNTFGIIKNYTFDNFIVGEFNKGAYNAAQTLFKSKY